MNLCFKFAKPNEGFEEVEWKYNSHGVPILTIA
jgi:hypothetical protein